LILYFVKLIFKISDLVPISRIFSWWRNGRDSAATRKKFSQTKLKNISGT